MAVIMHGEREKKVQIIKDIYDFNGGSFVSALNGEKMCAEKGGDLKMLTSKTN